MNKITEFISTMLTSVGVLLFKAFIIFKSFEWFIEPYVNFDFTYPLIAGALIIYHFFTFDIATDIPTEEDKKPPISPIVLKNIVSVIAMGLIFGVIYLIYLWFLILF